MALARDPDLIYWGFNGGYHEDERAAVFERECRKLTSRPLGLVFDSENQQNFGTHRPCVSASGDFYLLPKWLFLTEKSGILAALAANYAPGLDGKDEIYKAFVEQTIILLKEKLENNKNGIQLSEIFYSIRGIIQKKNLKPSRPQIISNPNWSVRYLVCDSPRIDIQLIKYPGKSDHGIEEHPFPISWLALERFSKCEVPRHVSGREDSPEAALIDVFMGDDWDDVMYVLQDSRESLFDALDELGFQKNLVRSWNREERAKVLACALGYERTRIPYYLHYDEVSRGLPAKDLYIHIEQRTIEVLMAWIQSFCVIFGTDTAGLLHLMGGPKIQSPYTLGDVLQFVYAHRASLKNNQAYATTFKARVPEKFENLLTEKCEMMLRVLVYMRNDASHADRIKNEISRNEMDEICSDLFWTSTRQTWTNEIVRRHTLDFFHHFYGGGADQSEFPCLVPTVMRVNAIEDTSKGPRAKLMCMRNGTEHQLVLNSNGHPRFVDALSNEIGGNPLRIGDRMYVLRTTNPTLVDPVLTPT